MKRYWIQEDTARERADGEWIRYDEAQAEIDAAFHRGAKAVFDKVRYAAANHWHPDPIRGASCEAENAIAMQMIETAFEDVSPEQHQEWLTLMEAIKENEKLKVELAALQSQLMDTRRMLLWLRNHYESLTDPSRIPLSRMDQKLVLRRVDKLIPNDGSAPDYSDIPHKGIHL